MTDLTTCLERAASIQGHRCPRQVLATRMGAYAGQLLGLDVPRADQRLLAFVELDGCFAEPRSDPLFRARVPEDTRGRVRRRRACRAALAVRIGPGVSRDGRLVAGPGVAPRERARRQRRLSARLLPRARATAGAGHVGPRPRPIGDRTDASCPIRTKRTAGLAPCYPLASLVDSSTSRLRGRSVLADDSRHRLRARSTATWRRRYGGDPAKQE